MTLVHYFADQQYQSLDDLARKSTKRYQHLTSVKHNKDDSENKDIDIEAKADDSRTQTGEGPNSSIVDTNEKSEDNLPDIGASTYLVPTPQSSIKVSEESRQIEIVDKPAPVGTAVDGNDNTAATRHSGVQYLDILPDIEESRL